MNSNYIVDIKHTDPILEWVLNKNNRDKYITEEPEHGGHVVVRDNVQTNPQDLIESGFPYKELYNIAEEIKSFYKLPQDVKIEPNYGYLICYSVSGHQVHAHNDPNFYCEGPDESLIEDKPDNYLNDVIHTRFNLLISKPLEGGNPVISEIEYNVKENELWRCLAGVDEHYTTKVLGSKPRILLSFGYFVPTEFAIKNSWYKPQPN